MVSWVRHAITKNDYGLMVIRVSRETNITPAVCVANFVIDRESLC